MEILPEQDFIRINKKEIIAAKIVKFFSADEITSTLLDEQNLPLVFNLGESYKKMFFEKFS